MNDPHNYADNLKRMAALRPFQKAVIFPASRDKNGRVAYTHLTYEQLDTLSDHVALKLLEFGFQRGMHTAFMVKPSLEFFVLTFALLKAGIIPVLVDPGLGLKHVKKCLAMAEAEGFIGIPTAHLARHILGWKGAGWKKLVSIGRSFPGTCSYRELLQPLQAKREVKVTQQNDIAAILFTSGSTGAPKPVVATHGNFCRQLQIMTETFAIQPGEYDLCTFAPFALFAPALGMTTVIPEMDFTRPAQVNPEKIKEAIDNFGINNMFGSPALIKTVGRHASKNNWSFPSLTRVVSTGGPITAEVMATFMKALPQEASYYTAYGATEAFPIAIVESRDLLGKARVRHETGFGLCLGRPADPREVKILRISDEPIALATAKDWLGPHEIGEIAVSGGHVTASYFKLPAANALSKMHDEKGRAFHRMGDVGYLDEEGLLWICGRKSHRVKRLCGDLHSFPVEGIFDSHPLVARSALVGLGQGPDQQPCLCVELQHELTPQQKAELILELKVLAARNPQTKTIATFLFHPGFPVDVRHNAKIHRESLKVWAEQKIKS